MTFEEMSKHSKRYLEASGEWELVDILGETSILQFGIDEWDIITFWVRNKENMPVCLYAYVIICDLHQRGLSEAVVFNLVQQGYPAGFVGLR